ncbi:hypothetical protein ROZALSC1DRAFT_30736 [Rozella allomycis CSF55]|uniref:Capsule synthesis protein, CapA domain-containing protein n=1 Tax=Rozella allomycis (strain CSF55) TaxID=988480 RepID=A0A075AZS6_ROZAC|nr:Capsule synthesis protein, CapA domain-containing protein [Rozella allomycis CSF55]RKP17458.1 hypothetical protein ROZALSC1DRAFT_30736 [Rozella allomycis CSF55]|eukprot:EPZ35594.1 Capsule synthesis protein, CapA domain-containing protein [Rozella allomycis CSF55]
MLARTVNELFPPLFPFSAEVTEARQLAKEIIMYYNPGMGFPLDESICYDYCWGDVKRLMETCDIRLVNLETPITGIPYKMNKRESTDKVAGKHYHFRMHPRNVRALTRSSIDVVNLANNHIMDYGIKGLIGIKMGIFGMTDAPCRNYPVFCIDPSSYPHMDDIPYLLSLSEWKESNHVDVLIATVHWGPNYSWIPQRYFQHFARFLIDECGVNIIHGHSAHHVQPIEVYHDALIIYGSGDLIDDYAIDPVFRNDLSAVYVAEINKTHEGTEVTSCSVHPISIKAMQSNLTAPNSAEYKWLKSLSKSFSGTTVNAEPSSINIVVQRK